MRCRHLEEGAVRDRPQPVDGARLDPEGPPGPDDLAAHWPSYRADLDFRQALVEVDRLVLQLVILQAQGVPTVDDQELAAVRLRHGVDELEAPGLVHSRHAAGIRL